MKGERALLEAYRDGELAPFARWRLERRLRREPALCRALDELDAVGSLLREVDAAGPEPDLWNAIRLRLVALDAARDEAAPAPWRRRAAGFLAVGAAAALALLLRAGEAPLPPPDAPGAVRWIDARGHPTLVLRDDAGGTIIWVPERSS